MGLVLLVAVLIFLFAAFPAAFIQNIGNFFIGLAEYAVNLFIWVIVTAINLIPNLVNAFVIRPLKEWKFTLDLGPLGKYDVGKPLAWMPEMPTLSYYIVHFPRLAFSNYYYSPIAQVVAEIFPLPIQIAYILSIIFGLMILYFAAKAYMATRGGGVVAAARIYPNPYVGDVRIWAKQLR